jgi:signal peptidase I
MQSEAISKPPVKKMDVWISVIVIITALGLGFVVPSHVSVTISPSMIKRVWWIQSESEKTKSLRNKYAMFSILALPIDDDTKQKLNAKASTAIKRVACEGGDRLTIADRNYYCNGNLLTTAKERKPFQFDGVIPQQMLFLLGDRDEVSYDSRYFGFIGKKDVVSVVYPLF